MLRNVKISTNVICKSLIRCTSMKHDEKKNGKILNLLKNLLELYYNKCYGNKHVYSLLKGLKIVV